MMPNTLYVTTPIYYVNARPHIGHAFTSTLADVICRTHKLLDYKTFLLTGTDEHGQKIQQAALANGITSQEHVDQHHSHFKQMSQSFHIDYDYFIRTTDLSHKEYVQKTLQKLYDQGDIYMKAYQGWYSIYEERFFSETELIDKKDPIGHREVEWLEEENYFFKMSKYHSALLEHLEKNKDFIQPKARRNEILGFLQQELKDLCISRSKDRLKWGIELPFDKRFVTYVWFDALLNYVSAVDNKTFENGVPIWPANWHIIGKDILMTHCIYWISILFATKKELPKHILAHAWWLINNEKMSKSKGNTLDPFALIEEYGVDVIRYYLMKEMVLLHDGLISEELIIQTNNRDLSNDIGNALQRIYKFVIKNFEGQLPTIPVINEIENEVEKEESVDQIFVDGISAIIENIKQIIPSANISAFMQEISQITKKLNQYIDTQAPWKILKALKMNKTSQEKETLLLEKNLSIVLYNSSETLRLLFYVLLPIMPTKSRKALELLGIENIKEEDLSAQLQWGLLPKDAHFLFAKETTDPLFPRFESLNEET